MGPSSPPAGDSSVLDLTARQLAAAIRRREVSAREALDAHYARVDAVNPVVNAVVTQCRERAYAQAARADELTASGAETPPLHGVPMTHKDTHHVRGVRTTHGSPVLTDFVPDFDDLVVQRFVAAGVVTTGKSNVPEFAAGAHTFNEVFGTTHNPYDTSRSAGGSSGGLAVALATRMQPLGDGSDMGGSLRNPAAFCNVVGFRPSHGVVPLAPSRDPYAWLNRVGPMARTVDDVALAMSVLAGPDPRVPVACPVDGATFAALTGPLGDRPLAGVRVGVTTDLGLGVPVEDEIAGIVLEQARVLEELGATVERSCPDLRTADQVFATTRAFDMAVALRSVVEKHGDAVKPEIRWNVEKGLALTATELMDATVARGRLHRSVRSWFERHDVLLTPTTQVLPFPSQERYPSSIDGVPMADYVEWMRSLTLISATGCPAVSVPGGFAAAGSSAALPVGLQLVGAHGRDVPLLRVARAYEAATRHGDRAPRLLIS